MLLLFVHSRRVPLGLATPLGQHESSSFFLLVQPKMRFGRSVSIKGTSNIIVVIMGKGRRALSFYDVESSSSSWKPTSGTTKKMIQIK
jgi:hypothetical protein